MRTPHSRAQVADFGYCCAVYRTTGEVSDPTGLRGLPASLREAPGPEVQAQPPDQLQVSTQLTRHCLPLRSLIELSLIELSSGLEL